MKGKFEPATLEDYLRWLERYLRYREPPTHSYDRPFGGDFVKTMGNFELEGEGGVNSRNIIVLGGGRLSTRSKLGHNRLFYVHSGEFLGDALWVPVYNDEAFLRFRSVREFIETGTVRPPGKRRRR